jgi:hypothetical protein
MCETAENYVEANIQKLWKFININMEWWKPEASIFLYETY